MTSRRAAKNAALGRQIVGLVALVSGVMILMETGIEFLDGAERLTPDQSPFENAHIAPLLAAALWVIFAACYLTRQIFWPHADADSAPGRSVTQQSLTTDEPEGAREQPLPEQNTLEEPVAAQAADTVSWRNPLLILAALVAYSFVMPLVGFLLATMVLFLAVVWILGSRDLMRDGIIGVGITVIIYFGFTKLLSISLPALVLWGISI